MRNQLFDIIGGGVFVFVLLVSLFIPTYVHPQSEAQDIKVRERELQKLRREIDDYEGKIKKSERHEKSTLELLDYYDRQVGLIRKLLRKLKDESTRLQIEIEELRRNIFSSEHQLQSLKNHYGKYVSSVYKYGRLHDLELLFTSKSLNQLAIRIEYLRRFSAQRKKDMGTIARNKSKFEQQSVTLQSKLGTQKRLIAQKATEEKRIKDKTLERQKLLASIRKNTDNYRKELQRKTKAASELGKIIADLVEKERIRKERDAERARRENRPVPETIIPEIGFGARRGKLPWPVSGGSIVARFGNQIHPQLKTVTQNTGIDISVPAGTDVRAVAEGEVALISWLPSYGNLVIINHNNGYRTVYTHLSEITVVQGQKVNERQDLGKSGESITGPVLHFELWKEREKQDPEIWLSRR